jgi:RNA polymerase sigma factor (sigma-70 family)
VRPSSIQGTGRLTWLATIARNRSLDAVRRVELPIAHDFSEALGVANADSPLLAHERKEDATRLLLCLEELGAERRDIVLKAYLFGMSRRQIAETIGRPLATIKTWLRRALFELREALDEAEAPRKTRKRRVAGTAAVAPLSPRWACRRVSPQSISSSGPGRHYPRASRRSSAGGARCVS